MDLKTHPPAEELDDTYAGHSIGHWEGDTLVVDTVGIREDVPLDRSRIPHSPKVSLVERFSQFSPGVLVNEITIEDPEVFESLEVPIGLYPQAGAPAHGVRLPGEQSQRGSGRQAVFE